jgi:hypothetical protein
MFGVPRIRRLVKVCEVARQGIFLELRRTAGPSTTLRSGRDDKFKGGALVKVCCCEIRSPRLDSNPRREIP